MTIEGRPPGTLLIGPTGATGSTGADLLVRVIAKRTA